MSELSLKEIQKEWHGSYTSYVIGFLASLTLTGCSFLLAATQLITGPLLFYSIVGLAVVQAVFQVLFFLHVGQEPKPRWETIVFLFMALVLFIIVLGSLWIMFDLDARVMSNMAMETKK